MNKKRNTYAEVLRLPYGQRIIITSAVNNWMFPVGTMGTIVEYRETDDQFVDDYHWRHWQEQFVIFDGTDNKPRQIRREWLAPIAEWSQR